MTGRIKRAIDVFLDAINKGTLAKGKCSACAVGNLVAHGMGLEIHPVHLRCIGEKGVTLINTYWGLLFFSTDKGQEISTEFTDDPDVIQNIEATEFTWEELAKIEEAFETSTQISVEKYKNHAKEEIRADQIKGLEAVVKVMLEMDEQQVDVKEVFTHKAELIPIQ